MARLLEIVRAFPTSEAIVQDMAMCLRVSGSHTQLVQHINDQLLLARRLDQL
jgi:hypothetical protein